MPLNDAWLRAILERVPLAGPLSPKAHKYVQQVQDSHAWGVKRSMAHRHVSDAAAQGVAIAHAPTAPLDYPLRATVAAAPYDYRGARDVVGATLFLNQACHEPPLPLGVPRPVCGPALECPPQWGRAPSKLYGRE